MPVYNFTNKIAAQLLANTSRKSNIDSIELCKNHFEIGKYLAYQILEEFELEEEDIQHVQGIKKGVRLVGQANIAILPLMRAGLYVGEGVRNVFSQSQFIPYDGEVNLKNLKGKTIIIVDSVINTGKSIIEIVEKIITIGVAKIIVVTLVMQKDSIKIAEKYQDISFYALRVSENKYVGKGGTDTGNRLFNTI